MLKEIKYSGFTAVPSDYECPDGQLAAAINLIPEDGGLRPVLPPMPLASCPSGHRPVMIHKVAGRSHLIALSGKSVEWTVFDIPVADSVEIEELSFTKIGSLPAGCEIYDHNVMGNMLLFATSDGMYYFLWSPDRTDYIPLGNHLPEISMEFALARDARESDSRSANIDIFDNGTVAGRIAEMFSDNGDKVIHTKEWNDALHELTVPVMAEINSYVADCAEDGSFLQPFFVRYALRLFDGTHTMLSAPVLMIPNAKAPEIGLPKVSSDKKTSVGISYVFPASFLYRRIISGVSSISQWRDIIAGIDIFVTPQVYLYEQNGDLERAHRYGDSYQSFSHFGLLSGNDHSIYSPSPNRERVLTTTGKHLLLARKSQAKIESDITSSALFYKVASIDFDDIALTSDFHLVEIKDRNLSNLVTLPHLEDEIYAHHLMAPHCLFPYNSRLSMANIELRPFDSFPVRVMTQFTYGAGEDEVSDFQPVSVYVCLKKDGGMIWTRLSAGSSASVSNVFAYDSISSAFPRWLFYPDSSAVEIILATSSGYWRLPLVSHDFMTGAYWFRGLSGPSPSFIEGEVPSSVSSAVASVPVRLNNRVAVSEVNNPFVFPVTAYTSVGNSDIIGLSSAAKPLSQGQFGQFPLYAFTGEGVWALEVSSTGSYTARQPIVRDVCVNPGAITQIDSSVLFPTDRGIMLISGSQTQCLSESIDSDCPFLTSNLPGINSLHSILHKTGDKTPSDSCIPTIDFSTFVRDCGIVYDYSHQRIYIYSKHVEYAYVLSMKSMQWGMIFSRIASSLNSYPAAMAFTRDNIIVSLSRLRATPVSCLFVTRALKLDSPDILKTVSAVIQRGNFARGCVSTVLYGSRDLIRWHLVWSSVNHYLRGFRGSPYKYFRIASVTELAPADNIVGASVSFDTRFANKLR